MAVDLRALAGTDTVWVVVGRKGVVWVDKRRLVAARRAIGWSQTKVGRALGHAGKDQVSAWERGVRRPDVRSLKALADLYKVDMLELLADDTGRTLEVWRVRTGRTQAETADRVARALGPGAKMSRETWAAIERGQRPIEEEELEPIAEVLGISAAQVLAAAGTTPTIVPEVVALTEDQVARLDAHAAATGRTRVEVLNELLDRLPPDS